MLPEPRIIVISPRGELSDTERAIRIYDTRLRPCSPQRRARLYELGDPAFVRELISEFTALDLLACSLEGAYIREGRDAERGGAVDEVAIRLFPEAQGSHTSVVIDPQQIVEGGESPQGAPFLSR